MSCGIYQILNTVTGKCYVGSSKNIEGRRWYEHRKFLIANCHHSIKLQRSWNKYGPDVWEWNILQECLEDQLSWLEYFWQGRINSFYNGYDSLLLTFENGRATRKLSEETKKKLSEAKQNISDETRKKMSMAKKGIPKTEEWKNKLRGRKHSEEAKAKMKGRDCSKEHRMKLSFASKNQSKESRKKHDDALRGRKRSKDFCKKIGDTHRGKIVSEETRRKLSIARRNRYKPVETTDLIEPT